MIEPDEQYKKAVILGAAGFIGINLAEVLTKNGFDIVCFDRIKSSHWPKIASIIIGEFAQLPAALLKELDNALVFHLVGSSGPSTETFHVIDELNNDVITTIRYLEETRHRALRWIFVSSGGTVYGHNSAFQIDESAATNPICSYGIVKLAIEKYFSLYNVLYKTDFIIARLSNPYGPWQQPQSGQGIIAALIHKALRGEPIEIWGDGEIIRDYIYIADAVEGLLAAAFGKSGDVYNVGSGVGTSINQLVEILDKSLKIPVNVSYTASRSVDVPRNVLDPKKLCLETGWSAETSLESGFAKTAMWFEQAVTAE